jgi:hypothetical protein
VVVRREDTEEGLNSRWRRSKWLRVNRVDYGSGADCGGLAMAVKTRLGINKLIFGKCKSPHTRFDVT